MDLSFDLDFARQSPEERFNRARCLLPESSRSRDTSALLRDNEYRLALVVTVLGRCGF